MVGFLKSNFFFLPALVLAFLLYSRAVQAKNTAPYRSLVLPQDAAMFLGKVCAPPSMASGRARYCKARLKLERVWSKSGLAAKAFGEADFFIPAELCEIYQPGKLYTKWRGKKTDLLVDQGALLLLDARLFKRLQDSPVIFESKNIFSCRYDDGFAGTFQKIRALSRLHFARLMFAWGDSGGLFLALLSGNRSYLSKDSADAFKNAGLSHVLALSGMHLSLLGGLAFALGKKGFGKRAARLLQFLAILAFVWFAGKSPSLFRALLCSLASIGAGAFKIQEKSPPNLLSLVFIVHVCLFPLDAFELSFMLSYGALFGIFFFNEICSKALSNKMPEGAGVSLGASAGAQFFTLPLSLKFFGVFAPAGVVSSAVISPFVTLFVYTGLVFVLISLCFPALAPICGLLLKKYYLLLSRAVFFFAGLPCLKI